MREWTFVTVHKTLKKITWIICFDCRPKLITLSPDLKSHTHKRSKSEAVIGTITDKAALFQSSTSHSHSTDNIDQGGMKLGLAFGKCPQHLLNGNVNNRTLTKVSSSSNNLKELGEDINQCCCWQVCFLFLRLKN